MAPWLTRLLAWWHRAPGRRRLVASPPLGWRRLLPVGLVGLAVAGMVVGARVGLPDEFDPTAPFVVGYEWGLAEEVAAQTGVHVTAEVPIGYDGQWFLGMAFDPLVRSDIVATFDRPQYRAQRPLFSMAGWVAAAGQPAAIPYAMLAVLLVVVGLGCAACARVATAYDRSRWWGLLFAAIPGVVVGVTYGTAEPMGLALAALGLALVLDRRYGWAGLAFAASALTKETYLAFAVVAAVFLVIDGWVGERRGTLRQLAARPLLVAGPGIAALATWWGYVSAAAPESQRTPNHLLDLPFAGWWQVFLQAARGEYAPYKVVGPLLLATTLVLLLAALVVAVWLRQTVLAYAVLLWSVFGLALVSIMLERFLSAHRVLAPAVLAAGLFLITAWPSRRARAVPPARVATPEPASAPVPAGPAAGDPP